MDLIIKQSEDDLSIIKKMKKSLSNKFRQGSPNDIDKAGLLACYLFILGKTEESKKLLDSFIYSIEYDDERLDVWGSVGNAIIFRSYVAILEEDKEKYTELVTYIDKYDFYNNEVSRSDLFSESLKNFPYNALSTETCTQTNKVSSYGFMLFDFLYFYQMLVFYKHEVKDSYKDDLKLLIQFCKDKLKETLLSPKQPKLSQDSYEEMSRILERAKPASRKFLNDNEEKLLQKIENDLMLNQLSISWV